jgi:uncharacterized Zn finger protein (UPF0148 family)
MLATTCTIDGAPLTLLRESFDEIDRVYVGVLVCPTCGRTWMDQRKSTQSRPGQMGLPF